MADTALREQSPVKAARAKVADTKRMLGQVEQELEEAGQAEWRALSDYETSEKKRLSGQRDNSDTERQAAVQAREHREGLQRTLAALKHDLDQAQAAMAHAELAQQRSEAEARWDSLAEEHLTALRSFERAVSMIENSLRAMRETATAMDRVRPRENVPRTHRDPQVRARPSYADWVSTYFGPYMSIRLGTIIPTLYQPSSTAHDVLKQAGGKLEAVSPYVRKR